MKSVVVLACYLLSAFGVLLMGLGFVALKAFGHVFIIVLVLWIAALVAHHRMSFAWVEGRRLGRRYSIVAFVLGVLGFLAIPLVTTFFTNQSYPPREALFLVIIELVVFSPATALAAYLNWYHASEVK